MTNPTMILRRIQAEVGHSRTRRTIISSYPSQQGVQMDPNEYGVFSDENGTLNDPTARRGSSGKYKSLDKNIWKAFGPLVLRLLS